MQAVQVPVYDFTLHQRAQETRRVEPADVVIIEGILVLHMESVRKLLNMKIFVDTDDDVRLARRCVPCLTPFSCYAVDRPTYTCYTAFAYVLYEQVSMPCGMALEVQSLRCVLQDSA